MINKNKLLTALALQIFVIVTSGTSSSNALSFASKPQHPPSKTITTQKNKPSKIIYDLQTQHEPSNPFETLQSIGNFCDELNISDFDVYGDFNLPASGSGSSDDDEDDNELPSSSSLRQFEKELSHAFGKDDAVFMPSGVMAQSVALLIHGGRENDDDDDDDNEGELIKGGQNSNTDQKRQRRKLFACHHSSHLLLHEDDGYRKLLNMDAVVISTKSKRQQGGISVPPMTFNDVKRAFHDQKKKKPGLLSTLILELPHRELGGKLTPWKDVMDMKELCQNEGVMFHCDGARIFEAAAGYNLTLSEIASPFDSVYISLYKGLGGISGAMLMGDNAFCSEARRWLRRFGGNLYTLLPYYVSGWAGYRKHVVNAAAATEEGGRKINDSNNSHGRLLTFSDKKEKMTRLVNMLSSDFDISQKMTFDPAIPETNMVHVYLRSSYDECIKARDAIEKTKGIRLFKRLRMINDSSSSNDDPTACCDDLGFGATFEWTIGDYNGGIEDKVFLEGWRDFAWIVKDS